MPELLEMRGIAKSFVGVEVLHGVDLDLRAGEVHAIVGENGAGKSTLMKVLAGVHSPDRGTIRIDGEEVSFAHPHAAQAAGVGIIYQEFNLLPDRTVAENVFVGREPVRRGVVQRRGMERATRGLLEDLGVTSFGPRTMVRDLSVAQQQVVEIVKARSLDARILVLDEPTAALADHEVELLFALVRRLQELGVGILYISHRLREVFTLSGLVGSGRTEVARAIFGADPIASGTIEIDGKPVRFRHPRQAIKAGLGFITEDRKVEGLAL